MLGPTIMFHYILFSIVRDATERMGRAPKRRADQKNCGRNLEKGFVESLNIVALNSILKS